MSTELSQFLELQEGELISHADVSKRIRTYIKENGLNVGKDVKMDGKLEALLKTNGTPVNLLTMNKYIKAHFVKEASVKTEEATYKLDKNIIILKSMVNAITTATAKIKCMYV